MKVKETETLTGASFAELVQELLVRLGEDPNREGLQQTPGRVQRSLEFLTKGYNEDPETIAQRRAVQRQLRRDGDRAKTLRCSACASTTCCRFSARCTSPIFPTAR